ncbi:DUF4381 domain-containing protein [Vibrio genomosp. F10]|uniref:DUF4381 domain-containing protein n=2 Tax=Vibrio genomosp. F10 TaxID=723171 RepID=A0A1B9R3P0_9VIBR|nr:DUF4381 domain-containing protein [Vibrio genomosp. F10]OCH78694.1 hypothetical protein A6E14_03915 [Vibrio genomosp. F10]OEE37450.1 hypothetical protein A1QO_17080 [Vibrio genomosp. F10 str. ZF-129]OEE92930.1 hypothetical protein A1QM_11135 [Vibrio genomosp. F10 str. 9ZC157]OEE98670.1 hypothetical protein A1QK_12060 [Vibrio genomosp. F10 str. 9ZD137]OEF07477.1 hypothetical protein A1QI_17150 [Vibrio genomosp. F10 str. 9ZB36]
MKDSSSSALLPLNDLQLPPVPSWFPLAWGWWGSALAIIAVIALILGLIKWNKKRLAPKQTALKLLKQGQNQQNPSDAIELVRQAALCYFPREQIAHLTGQEWYAFLDSHLSSPTFVPNANHWQQALYKKESIEEPQLLIEHCYQWVNEALPPKRGRKRG